MEIREILTKRMEALKGRLSGILTELKARQKEVHELEGRIDECAILLESLPKPADTTPPSETVPCQAVTA